MELEDYNFDIKLVFIFVSVNGGPAIVAPPFVCTGSASIFFDKLTLKIMFFVMAILATEKDRC
ncbi:hypothetical protein NQ317_010310 [Molorchus minor]|uniref:Uncharacterized protein n=1 Tax=Molorchus minor TaxID=1323400 RepID=A0ABQ9IYQ8_9CUCU|nr:hypothetical protein NQ317_010310 [Molorchus minor]